MKTACALGMAALSLLAGCGTSPEHSVPGATFSKNGITVPLPIQTPFDNSPEARAAYLESFEHGFRIGYAGYTASYHMTYTRDLQAHSEGYFAGQAAGAAAREAEEK